MSYGVPFYYLFLNAFLDIQKSVDYWISIIRFLDVQKWIMDILKYTPVFG